MEMMWLLGLQHQQLKDLQGIKDLPIIMAAITDPIGANLVKDLKLGGNITVGCQTITLLNDK